MMPGLGQDARNQYETGVSALRLFNWGYFMRRKSSMIVAGTIVTALLSAGSAAVAAHVNEVDVFQNGDSGWNLNPDPGNATPYKFSTQEASLGFGSLRVEPLSADDAARKFIGILPLSADVADFSAINYDFFVDTANVTDTEEFYLNIYANLPGSSSYYDCRYDYVPADGPTREWRTMSTVQGANAIRAPHGAPCGASPSEMPSGSTVSFLALNVGDTSLNDANVAGYFDKVVVDLGSSVTTYDFEPSPATKDDCKKGGFSDYGYKNQGECVSALNKAAKANKN